MVKLLEGISKVPGPMRKTLLTLLTSLTLLTLGSHGSHAATATDFTVAGGQLQSDDVKDVYIYDTAGDSISSTWKTDSSLSWYTEPLNDPDRGSTQPFPNKVYLVVTDLGLDIIDAADNSMWMRFISSGLTNMLQNSTPKGKGDPTSVYALNGKIYVGTKEWAVYVIDFVNDTAYAYWSSEDYYYNSTIANRHAASGWANLADGSIADLIASPAGVMAVNDVHAPRSISSRRD